MTAPRALVTGAAGFVGRAVVARLTEDGNSVPRCAVRRPSGNALPARAELVAGLHLTATTDWRPALAGITTVIHCAARVHVMRDGAADPLAAFRAVNVDGTLALARQAAETGVRRFVFVSSIGVNGADTAPGRPFSADDVAAPHSPYAQSKLEAEVALRALAAHSGLEVVIVRPPLVYGAGAPGNFGALLRAVRAGWPLPLGAVTDNRRSLIALDNLADLLVRCAQHPAAAGRTLLAADGEDVSTADLLRRLGAALGRPARLLPVPVALLRGAGRLLGKAGAIQQLCGSLQIDATATRHLLGWQPPIGLDDGLARAARALRAPHSGARALHDNHAPP